MKLITVLSIFLIFFIGTAAPSQAITRFSTGEREKNIPAPLELKDIWFYNPDLTKTIPDICLEWITVVFHAGYGAGVTAPPSERAVRTGAEDIIAQHGEIIDYYYDQNLAEDACFFRLGPDVTLQALMSLIPALNARDDVSYVHPTLTIKGRTIAFFDTLTLAFKAGVGDQQKAAILKQVAVFSADAEGFYRVNLFIKPFFHALSLLAEDIRVLKASPYLVELEPTIRATLSVGIAGGNLGDPIPFALRVDFSNRVSIDPSSIATIEVRPDTIHKELFETILAPYDYAKETLKSPIHIGGEIKFYAPGEYTIPPVEIKYHCPECSGVQDRSILTSPVEIKISSLVPAGQKKSNLIIPLKPPILQLPTAFYHRMALIHFWAGLGLLCLAVLGAVWCAFRFLAFEKERETFRLGKRDEALREQLQEALDTGPKPNSDPWAYLARITSVFRSYLIARYEAAPASSGGSGTVFWKSIENYLPETVRADTLALLRDIDTIAALEEVGGADLERIQRDMHQILDLSSPQLRNE